MDAHHRVPDGRHRGALRIGQRGECLQRVHVLEVVARLAPFDAVLQGRRQRLIDLVHVGELGLTAGAADFDAVQQRALARHGHVAAVGVPELGQRELAHRRVSDRHDHAVLIDIGDAKDFPNAFRLDDLLVKDFRLADAACEFDVFGISDVLLGEHQHKVLHPRGQDLLLRLRVHGLAHVDTAHFSTQGSAQGANGDSGRGESFNGHEGSPVLSSRVWRGVGGCAAVVW